MNILKNKICKDSNIRDVLYSFDVFDTIFTRSVAEPPAIFSLMQNVLMTDNSFFDIPVIVRKNFFTIRTESEAFIRANKYFRSLRKFLDKHGSLRKFFFEFYKNNEEKEAYLKILGQKITLKKMFGWRV